MAKKITRAQLAAAISRLNERLDDIAEVVDDHADLLNALMGDDETEETTDIPSDCMPPMQIAESTWPDTWLGFGRHQ